jgi:hypothetical protein
MQNITELVDRYIATWNETEGDGRSSHVLLRMPTQG